MTGERELLAGVELGGTKVIAVLARGREILDQASWPTEMPDETLPKVGLKLHEWNRAARLSALGIASFGPVRLDPRASDFACILKTPKRGWEGTSVGRRLAEGLDCPWHIDTDVNGAALAEYHWGAGIGCSSLCYVTIGTGVGGGVLIDGRPVHGAMHPEIGHLRLRRAEDDAFAGTCSFHGDCVEGLISGPALAKRLGGNPAKLPDDDPRWQDVASDIAELACAILLTTSAHRILIGGGVGSARPFLLETANAKLVDRMGGYLPFLNERTAQDILLPASLRELAGPLGAIALAMLAGGKKQN